MPETYRVTRCLDGSYAVEHRMPDGSWRPLKRAYPTREGAGVRAADLNLRFKYIKEATEWQPPGESGIPR
jgi:hypothetical protein